MHPSKMTFDAWCEHIKQCATTMTDGIFNWRNVHFNWAERYQDHDPLPTVIDALVVAAINQAKAIERRSPPQP